MEASGVHENMRKKCAECGVMFTGRVDKKFCSDQCRTSYHNRISREDKKLIRDVNLILRKNRRILAELYEKGKKEITIEQLRDSGFRFGYFTSIDQTNDDIVHYCYDHGYSKPRRNICQLQIKTAAP